MERGGWIERAERVMENTAVEDWEFLRCGGENRCHLWTPKLTT